ncbi:MAG TPA: filamentous hemagglutinin N-terminal domain-containing protein, partial [Xenococcaceae cyanobacterium]
MLASSYIFAAETAIAQITSDGTLDSQVELTNQQNIITGGQEVGTNLFHSFEEFSPVPDAVTYFDNHPQIENIFTRVTGGMPSVIDGIIKTNNASLFLLNPSGIILGNNAELNINGSFIATTAEQVIFADGTTFRAQVGNDQPLLTLSLPIGLQYGTNPGAIVVSINKMDRINQSNSSDSPLNSGKTLALLGGEVTFNNAFIAPAFDVLEIAGVGQEATIKLENINDNWQFDYTNVTNFANIQLNQTTIDSSIVGNLGMPIIVNLQGENISLNSSVIFNSFNQTAQDGGKISLTATNSIKLNQSLLSTQSGILDEAGNPPFPAVTGKGGDIFVSGREIILNNGSQILAETVSAGAGGNITIQAQEYLAISGVASFPSSIAVTAADTSSGSGGNIHIETNRLNITDGGRIDS